MLKLILLICATICFGLQAFGATWKVVQFGWLGAMILGIYLLV